MTEEEKRNRASEQVKKWRLNNPERAKEIKAIQYLKEYTNG